MNRSTTLTLAFATAALAGFALAACGPAGTTCGPSTCSTCCTAAGECVLAVSATACGGSGNQCTACTAGPTCLCGLCAFSGTGGGPGGGGGGGFGGGSGGGSGGGIGGGTGGGTGGGMGGGAGGGGASTGKKRVFVTSGTYSGNLQAAAGANTGLEGGDALCQTAATAANLGGTWKAWLSDGTADAIDRIADVGPWSLVGTDGGAVVGAVVFNNKANLATVPLTEIAFNENGASVPNRGSAQDVWTGTANGGHLSPTNSCSAWTSGAGSGMTGGLYGTANWTESYTEVCSARLHLYCFEQ